ncbi:TPA: hypothetical protein DDW35_07180 [Candidatus Sumerlaeota bacterium]|nr:hypothetical protein [Candidatus Sumerlaeota bacterium]
MSQRGIDLAGAVQSGAVAVRHFISKQTSLEEVFARLCAQVNEEKITRVVIDSLDDFERYVENEEMVKDYLTMFLAALARAGATVVFTQQLQALSGGNPISDIRHASLVDTVVYLGSVEIDSRIHKVISALKTRGGAADADLREIECDARGLHVTHKFNGLSGILQGSAQGQRKETVENVFQPLYFIRDFAQMGAGDDVTDAQRRGVLNNILNQLGSLESALQEYFGFNPEDEKKK